jgi:hypothetical protein
MKRFLICALLCASVASADRLYVPKVGPNETPVLEDGELAVGVFPDGEPITIKIGDGLTSGGRTLFDARTTIRTSPIQAIQEKDYAVSLSGSAYWTNGLISLFTPDTVASTNEGVVTITLLFADQKIQAVRTTDTGRDYSLTTRIAADGRTATLTGKMQNLNYPGVHPTIEGYIEAFQIDVYADRDLVGNTNDLRGMSLLVRHPAAASGKTNQTDYLAVSKGYYEFVVQDAVSLWSGHPALSPLTIRAGQRIDDGISLQQRFNWTYKPNGYLTLAHESDAVSPVLAIEAMDPYPWIITESTGDVSTIEFTTNGIAGVFRLQTSTNLITGGWTTARPLSTNAAPAGYASITASNTLAGSKSFWRVSVSNAVQATARAKFGVPVQAPRFELGDDTWLYWSNGLRIKSGSSNGLVNVTW